MADERLDRLTEVLADRYAILHELGSGGMATVYLAEDLKHKRRVAVKVLRPELAAALGPARFLREVEIAASLHHPHILLLIDSGEVDDFLYYVMPYVEGPSLREKLATGGELPIRDAVHVLRDVADALAHAHGKGVVHRDIKPDNVMLSGRHALVTDFGVAKAVTEATGRQMITTAGIALGTPAYMAPEQAVADPHTDHRADIYAFGVMAYELLTGRPPFLGPTPQAVLSAHVADPPEPVTKHREAVPAALGALVMRCLEKKPADRWQTAEHLVQQLEALSTPSVGITPTETQPVRGVPVRTGRGWIVGGAGLVAVLAVAAIVVIPRGGAPAPLNPNAFAIAPFDVLGSGATGLARDIAELVHHRLDGAGPLTGVPRAAVEQRWTGPADRASAARLGEQVAAGLVVFGRIAGMSSDSVRITATLLDSGNNRALGDYEATAGIDDWYDAASALAIWTLETASRSRQLAAVPLKSIGSTSPAAVKAFITGDTYYRQSKLDSARIFYEQAVFEDSAFALAHARLGQTKWNTAREGWAADFLRAGELNHGLAQRESLLVAWDSLYASYSVSFLGDAASWARFERLAATSERLVRLYPLDVEAWYILGEWRFHIGPYVGVSDQEAHDAFARAVQLDPGFSESLLHLMLLTLHLEGPSAMERVFDEARSRGSSRITEDVSLVLSALNMDGSPSGQLDELVAGASSGDLLTASYALKEWPDSAEAAVRFARAAVAKGADDFRLIAALAYRGHLAEARALILARSETDALRRVMLPEMARLGSFPSDSADRMFRGRLTEDADRAGRGYRAWYQTLLWWTMRRDTAALRVVSGRTDSALGSLPPTDTARAGYGGRAAHAYLNLLAGDTAAALLTLERLRQWPNQRRAHEWLARSQILSALGRNGEAAALLDRPPYSHDWWLTPERVVGVFERARVHERIGNRAVAIAAYSYVIDVWRHADSVLVINYVAPAREGLRRLTEEPRRD